MTLTVRFLEVYVKGYKPLDRRRWLRQEQIRSAKIYACVRPSSDSTSFTVPVKFHEVRCRWNEMGFVQRDCLTFTSLGLKWLSCTVCAYLLNFTSSLVLLDTHRLWELSRVLNKDQHYKGYLTDFW